VSHAHQEITQTFKGLPADPRVELVVPGDADSYDSVKISLRDLNQPETAAIHVREVEFLP
jgi:hypothetical protein